MSREKNGKKIEQGDKTLALISQSDDVFCMNPLPRLSLKTAGIRIDIGAIKCNAIQDAIFLVGDRLIWGFANFLGIFFFFLSLSLSLSLFSHQTKLD